MRKSNEIRTEIRSLGREYHQITCGELRDICRRYGDKQIYLVDAHNDEVPGRFTRIHDFMHSYRWELHPGDCSDAVGMVNESFGQWGGYIDVPVFICDTAHGADGGSPAFGEYTICGDRIVFRRNVEAYRRYLNLLDELATARKAEADAYRKELCRTSRDIVPFERPRVRGCRKFPPMFPDDSLKIPNVPRNRNERRHPDLLANHIIGVTPVAGPVEFPKSLRELYGGK
jgi:hypothetical protein